MKALDCRYLVPQYVNKMFSVSPRGNCIPMTSSDTVCQSHGLVTALIFIYVYTRLHRGCSIKMSLSLQPGTTVPTTYGQGTSSLLCPSSSARSSVCCGRSSCSTQTARYVRPDGDYRRRSGSGLRSRTHHRPRHDWRLRWRTLGACQA